MFHIDLQCVIPYIEAQCSTLSRIVSDAMPVLFTKFINDVIIESKFFQQPFKHLVSVRTSTSICAFIVTRSRCCYDISIPYHDVIKTLVSK